MKKTLSLFSAALFLVASCGAQQEAQEVAQVSNPETEEEKQLYAVGLSVAGNTLGTLINAQSGEKLNSLIDDAVTQGAHLAAGGKAEGVVMQATVIDGVTSDMRLYSEESFGPIVAVIRVNGEEEAIHIANDSEYGLSSAVFSRDSARAMKVAGRLQTGICHINAPTVHDEPQMPFGGVKSSGYGRFGGKAGIEEFTELRWMTMQLGPRHYPI